MYCGRMCVWVGDIRKRNESNKNEIEWIAKGEDDDDDGKEEDVKSDGKKLA